MPYSNRVEKGSLSETFDATKNILWDLTICIIFNTYSFIIMLWNFRDIFDWYLVIPKSIKLKDYHTKNTQDLQTQKSHQIIN